MKSTEKLKASQSFQKNLNYVIKCSYTDLSTQIDLPEEVVCLNESVITMYFNKANLIKA